MDSLIIQEKIILLIFIALIGCHQKPQHDVKVKVEAPVDVNIFREKDYEFVTVGEKTKFSLRVSGDSLLKATIDFRIVNQYDTIFHEKFESTALLGYGFTQNPSDEEKKRYILNRIDHFFDDENFVQPSIGSQDEYDEQYNGEIEKSQWTELKVKQRVGFYYLLFEGDQKWISYVPSLNKIMIYKKCC